MTDTEVIQRVRSYLDAWEYHLGVNTLSRFSEPPTELHVTGDPPAGHLGPREHKLDVRDLRVLLDLLEAKELGKVEPGSVLLWRIRPMEDPQTAQAFVDTVAEMIGHRDFLLFACTNDDELTNANPELMAKHGWHRAPF